MVSVEVEVAVAVAMGKRIIPQQERGVTGRKMGFAITVFFMSVSRDRALWY
jgi:hypothetical protein